MKTEESRMEKLSKQLTIAVDEFNKGLEESKKRITTIPIIKLENAIEETELLEKMITDLKKENTFWTEMVKGGLIREEALRDIINSQSMQIENLMNI